ncbi:hypothetical protein AN639_07690 [Candidatus Epulonipiscium fishelsonii]|uniref:Uncharacterized protein n=1 Tax=Candidatus Epulonipiscium fishelsonii TaxID=77094 RepID=A0ACC8XBD9_9FIRM|nr:hypothetical protein AN639_07690 [Epulopiscium sp. SCG-B05WGA-EpuloA1]ONI39787.1 hypothetical protein AN396_06950 [Epulopiscium sp. SCG-B11WGA-EpuloA1]
METLITGVLSLFCMVGLGFGIAKIGYITSDFKILLSKILINVIFPISLFRSGYIEFQEAETVGQLKFFFVTFSLIGLFYGIVTVLSILFKMDKVTAGVTRAGGTFTNNIFMGLPLCTAFLGPKSSLYVTLYFMGNTTLFWSMAVNLLDRNKKEFKIKQILAPPIRGFFLGLIFALIHVPIPDFLMVAINRISDSSTPLAMLYIGAMFFFTDYKSMKIDKNLGFAIGSKLILHPIVVISILLLPFFNTMPLLARQTFCMLAAMPTMSQVALVAGERNIQPEYANTIVLLTTLLSCLTIPIVGTIILNLF